MLGRDVSRLLASFVGSFFSFRGGEKGKEQGKVDRHDMATCMGTVKIRQPRMSRK